MRNPRPTFLDISRKTFRRTSQDDATDLWPVNTETNNIDVADYLDLTALQLRAHDHPIAYRGLTVHVSSPHAPSLKFVAKLISVGAIDGKYDSGPVVPEPFPTLDYVAHQLSVAHHLMKIAFVVFAGYRANALEIWMRWRKYPKRCQRLLTDHVFDGVGYHQFAEICPEALGPWRRAQADDRHFKLIEGR